MLNLQMNKLILFVFLTISSLSYSQIDIAKERTAMHKKFIRSIEYRDVRWEYEYAMYGDQGINDYRLRVKLGWTLGKIENLKTDIPMLLNHKEYAGKAKEEHYFRVPINLPDTPGSEWERQTKMATVLYDYFVEQSDSVSALLILKLRIEVNYRMENYKEMVPDLAALIPQIEDDDDFKAYILQIQRNSRMDGDSLMYNEGFFLDVYSESNDIEDLWPLIYSYRVENKDEKIISYKEVILADSVYFLKDVLAESALKLGDYATAKLIYDDFKNKLKKRKYDDYYSIALVEMSYSIDFSTVLNIANFYYETDPNYASGLYNGIIDGIVNEDNRFEREQFLNKLVSYSDEKKEKELLAFKADIEKKKELVLEEARSKILRSE
jgi:hypothetical protein